MTKYPFPNLRQIVFLFAVFSAVPAIADPLSGSELLDEARRLFEEETFDGNGRTCATCHTRRSGKLNPRQVLRSWHEDPDGPLFQAIDSDEGNGDSFERLIEHATVRIPIRLPDNVYLANDPQADTVLLNRGIPTTLDTPPLDPVLMYDGREPNLQQQALGAIHTHAEPGREPTLRELNLMARFQQTPRFFSSRQTLELARHGTDPGLPRGRTRSERRGRLFFVDSEEGLCSHCHSGPMLNETNEFLLAPFPPGTRFFTASVSEFNKIGNPVYDFVFVDPDNPDDSVTVSSPDPGLALITGDPNDANFFKITSLRGAVKRAPYFHDHSAKTLEELVQHYADYFAGPPAFRILTEREKRDIIAYLKLL